MSNTIDITLRQLRKSLDIPANRAIEVTSHEWEGDTLSTCEIVTYRHKCLFVADARQTGDTLVQLPTNQLISFIIWEHEVWDKYEGPLWECCWFFTEEGKAVAPSFSSSFDKVDRMGCLSHD